MEALVGVGFTHYAVSNEKKDNKQCLSDTPPINGQWRKLISRMQRPYKMAKFEKQLFNPKTFFLAWHFFMHMLYISILLMQSIRNLQ